MSLATDLMGLGMSPYQAEFVSTGGDGPLLIASAGTGTFASAKQMQTKQFCVYNTDTDGTKAISLPSVKGAATMADQYIIGNVSANTLNIYASTGVIIDCGASATSSTSLTTYTTGIFYPITSTLWIGVKGT